MLIVIFLNFCCNTCTHFPIAEEAGFKKLWEALFGGLCSILTPMYTSRIAEITHLKLNLGINRDEGCAETKLVHTSQQEVYLCTRKKYARGALQRCRTTLTT
uniref:Uncharacterized protein n=1 Tax=Romanomermis culicivorax TaxID=13658 RepID=A0A915IGB0_ROMCU